MLADQLSKYLVHLKLAAGESIPIIKNIFHITLVHNTGCAFGMFQHQAPILIGLSILVIVIVVILYRRVIGSQRIFRAAAGLLIGGASGNLIDRLRFGYVIDFLDFQIWPVFNIADSAITIGVALMLWKLGVAKK